MQRRIFLAGAAMLAATSSRAEDPYPSKPVRLVIPYAAGGGIDVTTRRLADKMRPYLGQSLFVDNRVGAGGMLGTDFVAQSRPDGYTLLMVSSSQLTQKAMSSMQVRYDPLTSFEHIVRISRGPTVLVVAASSPFRSVQELVAAAQSQPGKLNYASGGIGTPSHLAGAALAWRLKLVVAHVPYRGSVEIGPALVNGDTQFGFPVPSTAIPLIQQGRLRALAVTGAERLKLLPKVPTLKEVFGLDELVIDSWSGLWAPAGTPKFIIAKVNAAARQAMADKELQQTVEALGSEFSPTATPEEFTRFIQAETVKYSKLVAATGLAGN